MNSEAIGAIGELVSSLVVVVTLIYLAVQTHQTKQQTWCVTISGPETYGLAELGEQQPAAEAQRLHAADRVRELVCIGAAFGVNCVSTLQVHLDAAERVGISPDDVDTVVKLSAFIKGKAASHVERLAESVKKPEIAYEKEVSACC